VTPRAAQRFAALPERVRVNIKKDRKRPCGFCGIRSAQVGDLCCFCDEDADSKAEYIAKMAEVE
jgi:hypothetical protein